MLLGLAFICLLIGFLLLGMGAMANKYDLIFFHSFQVSFSLLQDINFLCVFP